jgi:hypothetical protein
MTTYNYNKNFNDFLTNISITSHEDSLLRESRNKIRARIRSGFNEEKNKYFSLDEYNAINIFASSPTEFIKPKFMTQGSYVYKTLNRPCKPPKQQMDLDDGVYLPLSYVESKTNADEFNRASRIIRNIIYKIVEELCIKNNWRLFKHKKCLRVQISENAHIDLPIYSIPDNELKTIAESLAYTKAQNSTLLFSLDSLDDSNLRSTNVLLASDDGWLKSDPRTIHDWVKKSSKQHSRFKKYSRIIKAWRDCKWEESNFSSIMIMAGLEQAMSKDFSDEESFTIDLSRKINSIIADINSTGIIDPDSNNNKRLDDRLGNERTYVISELTNFANSLHKASNSDDVNILVNCFGERFSKQKPESQSSSKGILASTPIIAPTIKPSREC